MHERVVERLELDRDLQHALSLDQLELHYQPVVRLSGREILGVEALVRWNHPTRGTIPPIQFIPVAEETGLIIPMGRWILETACYEGVRLQERFTRDEPLTMSVNLSVRQLQSETHVADVRSALSLTGLPASSLVLEITESLMLTDTDFAMQQLHDLKGLGIRLAMDDFGTGYSSLSYLSRFPVDILKMDRSFVGSADNEALTSAIIALGTSLSLEVVAEGIELAEQANSLEELGCELGQGYLFARPMDAASCRTSSRLTASRLRRTSSRRRPRMQHSYDSLDRPGGFRRGHLLTPLRHRDFRVLWMGMTVSLIGDGIFLVAIAWETYTLWNAPAALSIVGIGMTVPTIAFLLIGGVVSDRYDRRLVMAWADGLRAVAVGALAALIFTGTLQFWQLVAVVAFYGIGTAFFMPAFEAIVPDLIPKPELPAANALDQFVRPIALRLVGPVAGGALVALSAGLAFTIDAASFAASLAAVLAIPKVSQLDGHLQTSARTALKEGLRFVRGRVWLWGTLVSAALGYLLFLGPAEVLLPYLVKNELHASAGTLGLVVAAGGLGAVGAAVFMGQRGHPRRDVTVMYVTWTLATLAIAGYGIANAAWQLMVACLAVQRPRGGGHDRVGDDQAAARARLDAGASVEPRLAGLDRADATVVCSHCPGRGCRRSARDAGRCGGARCGRHGRCVLPARNDRDRADECARSRRLARTGRCNGLDRAKTPGYKRHLLMDSGFARLGDRRRLSLQRHCRHAKTLLEAGFFCRCRRRFRNGENAFSETGDT